jgi:hypothetical protein
MSIQAPATGIPDPEPPVEDGFDMKDADLTAPKDLEALAAGPLEQDPKLEPSPHSKPCSLCGHIAAMSLYDAKSILPKSGISYVRANAGNKSVVDV